VPAPHRAALPGPRGCPPRGADAAPSRDLRERRELHAGATGYIGVVVSTHARFLAGIELGGTWCRCVGGSGPEDIRVEEDVPTRDPQSTLAALAQVLQRWQADGAQITALGLASFGPLELRTDSPGYGRLGATPKAGWPGVDLLGFFAARFAVPIGLTTDVIGAALAEGRWGAARGVPDFAYVTVGTGVGAGLISGGRPVMGCLHPELGHIRIARSPADTWAGHCPFHGDCVEGLASGPAIRARTGHRAEDLPADHPAWDTVAHALAQLAHVLVLATGPRRILMGGGVVSGQPQLIPRIRSALEVSLGGYVDLDDLTGGAQLCVAPPALGARAGRLGALAVAADAATGSSGSPG
jgi:fructokinase